MISHIVFLVNTYAFVTEEVSILKEDLMMMMMMMKKMMMMTTTMMMMMMTYVDA